ncbi:hypothetical protein EV714DRAFT_268315 [Schizophyllum commune]
MVIYKSGHAAEDALYEYFASNLANETYTLRLANTAGENNSYFDLGPRQHHPLRPVRVRPSEPVLARPHSDELRASPSQTAGSGDSSSDNNSALALHNPLPVLALSVLWLVRRWL